MLEGIRTKQMSKVSKEVNIIYQLSTLGYKGQTAELERHKENYSNEIQAVGQNREMCQMAKVS